MGPGLGQHLRLGLESLPRLGTLSGPRWCDGQRTLGCPAVLGAAATTTTAVGPGRERDVEYDRAGLGVLEQQDLDPALTASYSAGTASAGPIAALGVYTTSISLRRPRFHSPGGKALSTEDRHRSKTGQGQTN
jgi:hypothetical protein